MGLIKNLRKSIYSPPFYRGLFTAPFSFSLKYFFALALSFAVAMTLIIAPAVIPSFIGFLKGAVQSLDGFPADAVVTIQNGMASTNVTSTIVLAATDAVRSLFDTGSGAPRNLIVVDTSSTFSEDLFRSYDTMFLLTRGSIVMQYGGEERTSPVGTYLKDQKIDKAKVEEIAANIRARLNWVPAGIVFGIFFVMFLMFAGILLYLLAITFLVWLILGARKIRAGYRKSYQIALHASSLGLLFLPFKILLFSLLPVSYFVILTVIVVVEVLINVKPGIEEPIVEVKQPEAPKEKMKTGVVV
jgi:hypothetical protein